MNLTTDVKTHVIVLKGKGRIFITAEQEKNFWQGQMQGVKGMKINNEYVDFNMVARLMKLETFYQEYPDDRPEFTRDAFTEKYPEYAAGNQQIRNPNPQAREQMKKGFVDHHKKQGLNKQQAEEKFNHFLSSK